MIAILHKGLIVSSIVLCTACVGAKSSETNKLLSENKQQSNVTKNKQSTSFEGSWQLVSVNHKSLTELQLKRAPFFTITGMNVTGFDGCNRFFGRIDQPANIAATRMGCPPEVIKIPLDLDNLLAHLQSGTLSADTLTVPARERFPASVFKRTQ